MLKRFLLPAALLLALLAPASAFASYVCRAEYFPGGATNARTKLTTTETSGCSGATKTWWICDTGGSTSTCGGLRYSQAEQHSLLPALTSAAKNQQVVFVSTTTCSSGTGSCLYSVAFGL